MKSKAAIAGHPIHAMLVHIPIGAFFLSFLGDLLHTARPEDPYWYSFSYSCIGIGLLFAVASAIAGSIDYLCVRMSAAAFRTATKHLLSSVAVGVTYLLSFLLRRNDAAFVPERWAAVLALSVLGLVLLGVTEWLGGKLVYEYRVGVAEPADLETPAVRNHVVTGFRDHPSDPGPARTGVGKGIARLHERGPLAHLLHPAASSRKQWER
ncbi:MAG TPA: DUF2231 domain-containing protein [Thermoanaerobaculia bacterium]|nr:DUF2231 domain-containing protein [Thermoanaerobaculia bacterium]